MKKQTTGKPAKRKLARRSRIQRDAAMDFLQWLVITGDPSLHVSIPNYLCKPK